MKLLLYGPPGAGKDTQGHILAQHFGAAFVSAGRLLRSEMRQNTDVGQAIVPYVRTGELVPPGIVHRVVQRAISRPEAARGYIMNGYPRTIETAEAFLRMDQPSAILVLNVSEPTVRLRLEIRARFDDVPGVIERRMRHYHERTPTVLGHFEEAGIPILHIDGEGSIGDVSDLILRTLVTISAPAVPGRVAKFFDKKKSAQA